jgi:hypothetical protein
LLSRDGVFAVERFLGLPRYPFTQAMIELAPQEPGVFGLFDGEELIYIGCAIGGAHSTLRNLLSQHCRGVYGACTAKATAYTWEISLHARMREAQLLSLYSRDTGRSPRCHGNAG